MDFSKGDFRSYRATTKIHLGKIERDIFEGDIIEFDGQTLKHGGEEFALSTVRGAISAGWFVDSTDNVSKYIPKKAGIKIRPAQAANIRNRGEEMEIIEASDEERVVGTLADANLGSREGRITEMATQEGIAVGKIKTAAVQNTTVVDANQAAQEIRRLDGTPPPKVENTKKVATGDVEVAMTGESLTDILPDAAVQTPLKKTRGANVISLKTSAGMIAWDTGVHWKTRAKTAVQKYGNDAEAITAIVNAESPGVQKAIKKAMTK